MSKGSKESLCPGFELPNLRVHCNARQRVSVHAHLKDMCIAILAQDAHLTLNQTEYVLPPLSKRTCAAPTEVHVAD